MPPYALPAVPARCARACALAPWPPPLLSTPQSPPLARCCRQQHGYHRCRTRLPPAEHAPPTGLPPTACPPPARLPRALPRRAAVAQLAPLELSTRFALHLAVPCQPLTRCNVLLAALRRMMCRCANQPLGPCACAQRPPAEAPGHAERMRASLQRSCAAPAANMQLTRRLVPLAQALRRRHRDRSQRPRLGLRAPAWPIRTQCRAPCQLAWLARARRARPSCRRAAARTGVQRAARRSVPRRRQCAAPRWRCRRRPGES